MRSPARFLLLLSLAATVLTACNGDDTSETTTSIGVITTTSLAPLESSSTTTVATSTTQVEETTTTRQDAIPDPEWTIAQRVEGENGATVVIQLEPESYERLTDIDIQNIVENAREMFPPIFEVHVVDSDEAAAVVLSEVIDTDDQAILDDHYLARLEEGFRLVFVGPFSDFGQIILTS